MTSQRIYLRALDRLRTRIAAMERNLNGASLSVHEEFEELCLIVALLEELTRTQEHYAPAIAAPEGIATALGDTSPRRNGAAPSMTLLTRRADGPSSANPVYAIIDIEVQDPEALALYAADHEAAVEQHGGRVLVARSSCEVVEGDWHPKRIIVQRWPNAEAFHRWYDSEHMEDWKHAPAAIVTNVVLVEGNEG